MYSKWFNEYHKLHPDIEINYQSIGSGGGIRQVLAQTVDFGASDGPMTNRATGSGQDQDPAHSHRTGCRGSRLQRTGRKWRSALLTHDLANICLGKITSWNDKAIAGQPGREFPGQNIIVVHRSDGSGTNYIFTDYLSKVSPEWGAVGKGTSVKWPVGLGGKGNEGVAGMVRQMDGAFGYVELIYAVQNHIDYGIIKNAAGEMVKASLDGATAAAASVKNMPADFRVSITNAPGKEAYPISSFTWLLIPVQSKIRSRENPDRFPQLDAQ